ncbi:MAG TPA: sugar ABC transporter substrate-binding protein [Trebonia sp.]|nr:sugar ABC transporter substrate-binding protein [Trebonia sp.]
MSGSVTMWIYPIAPTGEAADWKPRVAAFEKLYPHVKVNVVVQPWANRDEQLETAIAGGKGPDVVYLIPDQIPGYANSDSLENVASMVASDKKDFYPSALSALTYNGTLYGVPLLMQATTLLANKKILQAAGISQVPSTWSEFLADAPKIKAAGYYVTEYDAAPDETLNESFYPLLWQAGGQVLTANNKQAAFNSSAGVAALSFLQTLVKDGYVPKDPLTVDPTVDTDPIEQGKVAFVMTGDVASLTPTAQSPLSDWEVAPPLSSGADGKTISYGTVGGLSILSGSQNKAAAAAWVNWVTSTAQIKTYDQSHDYFSPRISVGTLFSPSTLIGQEEKMLPYVTQGSIDLESRQIISLLAPKIQAALLGQPNPQQALNSAATAVNSLLARSGG